MTRLRHTLYLSVLLMICLLGQSRISAYSQVNQSKSPVFYGFTVYYGKFEVHTKSLYPYNGTHPFGLEFEISQFLLEEKIRETFGTFIKWGVGLNYVNFDHEDLGFGITSLGYIEPFFDPRGRWRFSIKAGAGIAYMSHPYDAITNPKNLTYSTTLAFPLFGGGSAYYFFNKQLALKATTSFQHISNGGIKQPNLGINYPVIALGVEFTNNNYSVPPKKLLRKITKEKRFDLLLAYSAKEDTTNTNNISIGTLVFNRSWQVSRINALTTTAMFEYQQQSTRVADDEQISLAPLFGNEFLLGKLRFGQQMGVYLAKGGNAPSYLLQNYYLRYIINSRIMAGVNLKAHGRVADYLSVQCGITF